MGGRKSKKIGEGYKIFYSGKTNIRNGVGTILKHDRKIIKGFQEK